MQVSTLRKLVVCELVIVAGAVTGLLLTPFESARAWSGGCPNAPDGSEYGKCVEDGQPTQCTLGTDRYCIWSQNQGLCFTGFCVDM